MIREKFYIYILFLMFTPSALFAQKDKNVNTKKLVKKEISNAKSNIKRGDNLEGAENSMRNLLKDSSNIDNEKIWLTLFNAVKKQYEQLNEKLYLGQQSDTAKFFIHTLHMFDVLENLDSINAKSSLKDKSNTSYRKKHASFLDQYRTNLFGGGGFYIQRHNYNDAYSFFKTYLECAEQPLFQGYDYLNTDKRMVDAAYWAVFCGYKMGKPDIIDKYSQLAMKNPTTNVYILQYIAESYLLKKDSNNYGATLEEGFLKYPSHTYFFPHLANYYANKGLNDKVLDISAEALALDPNNLSALLIKSSALLNAEEYDECVKVCDKAIAIDKTKSVSYLNAGLAYYNKAIPYAKKKKLNKTEKEEMLTLYKRALPYLTQYRELMPKEKGVWALPLYNIYLNLNMGNEFEEIEKLIN